jgi:parvulin-like peptidyl-prolyl isomerase
VGAILASSCGSHGPPKVAAVVDGVSVPSAAVERLSAQYLSGPPDTDANTGAPLEPLSMKEVRQLVVEYAIRLTYLEKIAKDRQIIAQPNPLLDKALQATSAQDFAGTGWTANDLKTGDFAGNLSKLLAQQLFPKVAVSDTEVRQQYDANKTTFSASWSASVRAAFFAAKDSADQVRRQVLAKAPFDPTARQLGGTQVGSMGTVTPSTSLPQNILDVIGKLQPGQVSDPLAASGGWLLFYIDARQDFPAQSYDQASGQLRLAVEDKKRQLLFTDWFSKQLKGATVRVDAFYGKWSKTLAAVT